MVKRMLASGGYEAEVIFDPRAEPPIYHFIVTAKGSAEILGWGQELTVEAADRGAMDYMHDLYEHHFKENAG